MLRASVALWCGVALLAAGGAVARKLPDTGRRQEGSEAKSCDSSLLFNFEDYRRGEFRREVPVWRTPESSVFYFDAGMTIDADGAPNAYNPQNTGLDDLKNAGEPGHWEGLAKDKEGNPYVQGPNDPFPGYYVSCTSLTDWDKDDSDPAKYVDASKIPFIVLPREVVRESGTHIGDFAVVFNLRNGRSSYAIFADVGTMGEGSVALAKRLGIDADAREGGTRGPIRYLVFPGSGNGRPRTLDEITSVTEKLFEDWGGTEQATACATPN
jgi:hypothetical protein